MEKPSKKLLTYFNEIAEISPRDAEPGNFRKH